MKEHISDSIILHHPSKKFSFCEEIDLDVLKNLILSGFEVSNYSPLLSIDEHLSPLREEWFGDGTSFSGRGGCFGYGMGFGDHETWRSFSTQKNLWYLVKIFDGAGHINGNGDGSGSGWWIYTEKGICG